MTDLLEQAKANNLPFPWDRFNEIFPYADISLSEGEFEQLLENSIVLCKTSHEAEALVDLVELQLISMLEQFDVQNKFSRATSNGYNPLEFEIERLVVKVQVVSNVRRHNRLAERKTRSMILTSRGSIIQRLTRQTN